MNSWTAFERRWGETVLSAMLPPNDDIQGLDTESLQWFWDEFETNAPSLLKIGLRFSVWFVTWVAVFSTGRLFHRASALQKDRLLQNLSEGAYLSRQLIVTIKVVATLAYFGDPKTRGGFRGAI
jgi:hypothetical protein